MITSHDCHAINLQNATRPECVPEMVGDFHGDCIIVLARQNKHDLSAWAGRDASNLIPQIIDGKDQSAHG